MVEAPIGKMLSLGEVADSTPCIPNVRKRAYLGAYSLARPLVVSFKDRIAIKISSVNQGSL